MTSGLYGYYDTKEEYVVYIGKDMHIDAQKRNKEHHSKSMYGAQKINQVVQNNPNRYVYFKFFEGNYTRAELNTFEKEAIDIFQTFKYDNVDKKVFNFTKGGDGSLGICTPYSISKSSTSGFQILSKQNNKPIKRCVNKNKLFYLIDCLNNGTMTEDDVKKYNLNPWRYTISKDGHGGFQIYGKNHKVIKRCIQKDKLKSIVQKLNNNDITEEEVSNIKIELDFIFTVSKSGKYYVIHDKNRKRIKQCKDKNKLDVICNALNHGQISIEEVSSVYGTNKILKKIGGI